MYFFQIFLGMMLVKNKGGAGVTSWGDPLIFFARNNPQANNMTTHVSTPWAWHAENYRVTIH
jgi:hypothetical protein